MIPETQCIEILLGQALELTIPVTDSDGNDVNVEGATVEFGLGPNSGASPTETLHTSESGNEITVTLSTAKCLELGAGMLFFSCWVTIAGDATPVAMGWLRIIDSTRG